MPTVTTTVTSAEACGKTITVTTTEASAQAPVAAAVAEPPPNNGYPESLQKGLALGLDSAVGAVLHMMDDGAPTELGVIQNRDAFKAFDNPVVLGEPHPGPSEEDIAVPSAMGGDDNGYWKAGETLHRVFRPSGSDKSNPIGCLYFIHGGGYVLGNLAMYNNVCRYVCEESGLIVIAPEYRYGPEFEYPLATDDCYASLVWVTENAASLGIDLTKLAIGGDSAGGNAAGVVAMMCRDKKGPKIALQWLLNPWIDLDFPNWPKYDSYNQFHTLGFFKGPFHLVWMAMNYFGSGYQKKVLEGYASPTRNGGTEHADLSNLPKCINAIFSCDPLHDMGAAHGKFLKEAGCDVTTTSYKGQIHGCYIFAQSLMPSAMPCLVDGCVALKAL